MYFCNEQIELGHNNEEWLGLYDIHTPIDRDLYIIGF